MHYRLTNTIIPLAEALAGGWRALADCESDAARGLVKDPEVKRRVNEAFEKSARAAAVAEAMKAGAPLPKWKLQVGLCLVFRAGESVPGLPP